MKCTIHDLRVMGSNPSQVQHRVYRPVKVVFELSKQEHFYMVLAGKIRVLRTNEGGAKGLFHDCECRLRFDALELRLFSQNLNESP